MRHCPAGARQAGHQHGHLAMDPITLQFVGQTFSLTMGNSTTEVGCPPKVSSGVWCLQGDSERRPNNKCPGQ